VLTAFAITMDGVVYAAYLFIVAIGLSLIFGVMKILNVAHGAFYAFGAYGAATVVGVSFDAGWPVAAGLLMMILAAMAIGLVIGLVLERVLLRLVYGRDEIVMLLVTYAAFLILEDLTIVFWGTESKSAYQPLAAAGNFAVGGFVISGYDVGLILLAAVLAVATFFCLNHTRYGRLLTAVIFDREMAACFGINVTRVFTITFVIGAMLGALSGAVMAPKISVTLGIGVEVIVLAFAVVAIGGMGSVEGALVGAILVGLARSMAVHLMPELELFVIYAVMALVLVVRPHGLFTRLQPRKI
jgi:branched-chain amino acid transport system permease protein